jgi:hypothetical protein
MDFDFWEDTVVAFPGPKGRVGHPDLTQNIGQTPIPAAEIQRAPAPPATAQVKPGDRRRQIPQRSRSRQTGRAQTTTSPSSPIHTPSTTARCRPTSRAHTLIPRTSHLPPRGFQP